MDITAHKGGNVQYHDPHIPKVCTHDGLSLSSADLSAEALAQADVVVLTTNHNAFNMEFVQKHAKLIVDMRNMIKEASDKIYKL